MLNVALYVALRAAAWVVPFLPPRLLYGLAEVAGTAAYAFFPAVRRVVLDNLAHALPERSLSERKRIARRIFRHDARNWGDTLRIARLSSRQIEAWVRVDGWSKLEAAIASGSGAVVVTMHLGNFDLVGQYIAARGARLTVPVERMKPEKLFEFLQAQRASQGITVVPVEQAARHMIRALQRGEIVGIAVDRHVAGKTVPVDYFGERTEFSRGFASLIRHADVPVFLGVGVRTGVSRYAGMLTGPLEMVRGGGLAEEIANTQAVADRMESLVRQYPEQWLAFWRIWPLAGSDGSPAPTDGPPESPATMGQQTKAAV